MTNRKLQRATILLFIFSSFLLAVPSGLWAQSATRITQPVDDAAVVRVPRSTHPYATALNDLGRARADLRMERMMLILKASDPQQAAAETLLNQQHDKESPAYHQWVSPEEYGRQFGPNDADLAQVSGWLQRSGFQIHAIAHGRQWIEFSGNASQVERAFHTEMHHYVAKGERHLANAKDISVPAALAPVIGGVLSLHDFRKQSSQLRQIHVHRDQATGKLVPDFTLNNVNGTFHFLVPGDFARIYNTEPLLKAGIDGTGMSIAVVGRSNINLSDVQTFRQIFHLPANDPRFIINGQDPGVNGDEVESDLDVEWSGAVAPKATIKFVTSSSTFSADGTDLSAAYIVDNRIAPIMSSSYGLCEAFLGTAGNAFFKSLYRQAAAEGITVFVSTGDDGSAGCDFPGPDGPAINGPNISGIASTPYNTAVGGTQFNENGLDGRYWLANNRPDQSSATGYIPESVWNESCDPTVDPDQCFGTGAYFLSAGSGGPSNCSTSTISGNLITCVSGTPKPSWQAGIGVPNDGVRDIPDLSLAAGSNHDGFLMCTSGSCQTVQSGGQTIIQDAFVVGGTSASTPAMAAIMALLEQKNGAFQGLANYTFYQLAAAEHLAECNSSKFTDPAKSHSCVFYDVTSGNNGVPGQPGYQAGKGYDMSTGLGTINAENLVSAWSSAAKLHTNTALAAGLTIAKHGSPIPIAVAVAPSAGQGAPTGDFSLLTEGRGAAFGGTLRNGTFSGTVSDLPGGSYDFRAHYSGDAMFAGSTSDSVPIRITPEKSILDAFGFSILLDGPAVPLPDLNNQISYGFPLAFQVDARGESGVGRPTGKATLTLDDTTQVGSIPLAKGGTGFHYYPDLNPLPGKHHITVAYSGDNSFQPTRVNIPFHVRLGITRFFIDTIPTELTEGAPVKLFMNVVQQRPLSTNTSLAPTGTIDLWDNGKHIAGPFQLAQSGLFGDVGQAVTTVNLPAGQNALSLTYSGDSNYQAGFFLKHPFLVTVHPLNRALAKVTLQRNPATVAVGQAVNYVMTVRPATPGGPMPTGTVILESVDGFTDSPAVPLVNGNATFTQLFTGSGVYLDNAAYSGDSHYSPENSRNLFTYVTRLTPTVILTSAGAVVQAGQPTSVSVTVIGRPNNHNLTTPAGLVRFYDSVNGAPEHPLSTAQYLTIGNGGNAIYTLPVVFTAGTHRIRCEYFGSNTSPIWGEPDDWAAASSNKVSVVAH